MHASSFNKEQRKPAFYFLFYIRLYCLDFRIVNKNIFEDIRRSVDIVEVINHYVPLMRAGKNYKGLCPFHSDSNPSMLVSPEKQIFTCFLLTFIIRNVCFRKSRSAESIFASKPCLRLCQPAFGTRSCAPDRL